MRRTPRGDVSSRQKLSTWLPPQHRQGQPALVPADAQRVRLEQGKMRVRAQHRRRPAHPPPAPSSWHARRPHPQARCTCLCSLSLSFAAHAPSLPLPPQHTSPHRAGCAHNFTPLHFLHARHCTTTCPATGAHRCAHRRAHCATHRRRRRALLPNFAQPRYSLRLRRPGHFTVA